MFTGSSAKRSISWNVEPLGMIRFARSCGSSIPAAEAELLLLLPYSLASLDTIARISGNEQTKLKKMLEKLCRKGLAMDLKFASQCYLHDFTGG